MTWWTNLKLLQVGTKNQSFWRNSIASVKYQVDLMLYSAPTRRSSKLSSDTRRKAKWKTWSRQSKACKPTSSINHPLLKHHRRPTLWLSENLPQKSLPSPQLTSSTFSTKFETTSASTKTTRITCFDQKPLSQRTKHKQVKINLRMKLRLPAKSKTLKSNHL